MTYKNGSVKTEFFLNSSLFFERWQIATSKKEVKTLNIRKIWYFVIGFLTVPFLSAWVVAFIGNLFIFHVVKMWPDFSVLFINDKSGLKLALVLTGVVLFAVVWNFIVPERNANGQKNWRRLKTRDEKQRYSKLLTEKEIIKALDLQCVEYGKNKKPVNPHPQGGVLVGSHTDKMYIWPDYIHSIYTGTTKSGKTESLLMPQLQIILDARENAVVIDPKATLYSEYGWRFREAGYKVYRINFINPLLSDFRNPFESGTIAYLEGLKVYQKEMEAWREKRKMALKQRVPLSEFQKENPKPVFNNSKAIELWTDVASLLTYEKNAGEHQSWNNLAKNMIVGGACLLAELERFDNINIRNIRALFADPVELQEYLKEYGDRSLDSFNLLSSFINSPDKTRDSMVSVFNEKTQLLDLNKEIRMMTSYTNVDFLDLVKENCIIFFNCHDEKDTYFPLMSLFVDQAYQDLVSASRQRLINEGIEKLPIPINFIFEEFGIMHPLKNLKTMIGACRSRGIRLYFFVQDFLQLVDSYGKEMANDIIAQCQHLVYLLSGDEQTKKDISSKAGTRLVWNKDKHGYQEVPVLSVDQLNDLKMGEFVSLFQRIKGCCKHQFAYYKKARYYIEKPKQIVDEDANEQQLKAVEIFSLQNYVKEMEEKKYESQ